MIDMEYDIKYDIRDDQLIAILVTVGNKEEYISNYELNMLIAEYVHNHGKKVYVDDNN